jgi:hypothetical protein
MRLKVDVNEVGELIGEPPLEWEARCHEIACAIVEAGIIAGAAVYGHYRGPIADGTCWERYRSVGFVHHAWIVTTDDKIVDPLRWSFEGIEPYLYETSARDSDYDEGGNVFRESLRRPCPTPTDKPCEPVKLLFSDEQAENFVCALLGITDRGIPTLAQVFWLANLPLQTLGAFAVSIYQAVCGAGHGAFIPIDNAGKAVRESA